MTPNNYFIILFIIIAGAAGAYGGYEYGTNKTKVEMQAKITKIEVAMAEQKAEAATQYQKLVTEKIAADAANAKLISDGAKERENNRKVTDDLNAKYRGVSLRYAALKKSGAGSSGDSPQVPPAETNAEGAATEVLQLPDGVTNGLRQLTSQADNWLDEYRTCYAWVEKVACP
jgi:hypothetical protein